MTVDMYSNSLSLDNISLMGFDSDFFSMAQMPTMTFFLFSFARSAPCSMPV